MDVSDEQMLMLVCFLYSEGERDTPSDSSNFLLSTKRLLLHLQTFHYYILYTLFLKITRYFKKDCECQVNPLCLVCQSMLVISAPSCKEKLIAPDIAVKEERGGSLYSGTDLSR